MIALHVLVLFLTLLWAACVFRKTSRVESSRVDGEKKYVKMRQWKWEMPHVARVTVIRYMYDVALLSELLYMLLTIDNEGMI